mmetsp:Transcript_2208/g.5213  ORF Transcript_2208/g.5213 Transcript_2208/m.5213 type:complete len:233 (+) Transcript_2208:84-782(+)
MCVETPISTDAALFVYGTLKRGFANYARYLGVAESNAKATYVSDGLTLERFPMVVRPPNPATGSSGAPQLLDEAGNGSRVKGEVYLIDEDTLEAMDLLEGVHRGRYRRQYVHVQVETASGELRHMECATYFFIAEDPALKTLPHLENYTSEHNSEYISRPINDEILALCQKTSTLKAQSPKELSEILHSVSQISLASCSTGISSSESLPRLAEEAASDLELLTISDSQVLAL